MPLPVDPFPVEIYGFQMLGYGIWGNAPMKIYESVPGATTAPPEKVLFLSPRSIETATITASSSIEGLGPNNIKYQDPAKVWRPNGDSNQYLDITFVNPVVANALGLTWPSGSFTESAKVQIYGYALAGDVGVTPAYYSGIMNLWPEGFKHGDPIWGNEHALVRFGNVSAYRFWRVVISDPLSPNGYFDIGRIALDKAVQFRINPQYDGGLSFVPIDVQEASGYGQTFTDPRPYQQRQFELVWNSLARDEIYEDAMEMSRLRGQAGDVYVYLDPAQIEHFHRLSMQAVFSGAAKYTPTTSFLPDKDGQIRQGYTFTVTLIQKL